MYIYVDDSEIEVDGWKYKSENRCDEGVRLHCEESVEIILDGNPTGEYIVKGDIPKMIKVLQAAYSHMTKDDV